MMALVAGAAALSACSSSESAPKAGATAGATTTAVTKSTVNVTLKDFGVVAVPASARPGSVTFSVQNSGVIPHEFVVVKSDLAPDKLPQFQQKLVDEKQVQVVSKTTPFDPGAKQDLTVMLQPGKYVLLCNIASHYVSGMFAGFEVPGDGVASSGGVAPTGSPPPRSGPAPSNDGY